MARGRMLSKSLSTSEKFASLVKMTPLAEACHALYPLLVAHADDFGRLQGDAFTVKLQCYPASDRSFAEFEEILAVLQRSRLIFRYEVLGKWFIQIEDFEQHQSGLHKRTRSRFPEPPGISRNSPEILGQEKRIEEKRTKERTAKSDLSVYPDTAEAETETRRAGALLIRYSQLYSQFRHGAKLRLLHNSLEFQDALSLVRLWDDAHLDKLIEIVLRTDDEWISQTDRGFRVFASRASWADDRLREVEHGDQD